MANRAKQSAVAGGSPERAVNLPRDELLRGSGDPPRFSAVIDLAEEVLRTWQQGWTEFLDAPMQQEVLSRLGGLSELRWQRHGGHPGAERCRLLCQRSDQADVEQEDVEQADVEQESLSIPVQGLLVEGNFLFDPLSPEDLRQALQEMGASPGELGDLWVRGDRGGQGLCSPECSQALNRSIGAVRDVPIRCEAMTIGQLQLPAQRIARVFASVEASCRLDAIASAGFGISRAKVVAQIKSGRLRMNWGAIRQASRELAVGDSLQLQDRGTIEVLSLSRTKRDRWRVEMRRS